MFEVRDNEPDYALLNDPTSKSHNCYDQPIDTVHEGDPLHGKSLKINGDDAIGENPNRYKQHGFYFNVLMLIIALPVMLAKQLVVKKMITRHILLFVQSVLLKVELTPLINALIFPWLVITAITLFV